MRRIALSLIALVALGTGALGWYVLRPERSLTGAALGRLRLGVTRANLNLLVVTLDTTRADRLGAYGYTGAQTPTIDRLARDGVLFEQAITSAPLTLPAHSTLFTGRFPPAHGVRDNGGFYLECSQLTLAEVLRGQHVRTRVAGKPYDAEIAFADAQLARLLEYLGAHDLLDRTVIVVMGDHGESLGDHGEQSHGFFIYETVIRVPLIIRAPYSGMHGRRV